MMSSLNYDGNQAWPILTDAIDQDFMVGCDTNSTAPFGLVPGHAHTVVSYHQIVDLSGNTVVRLLRIRNPWGKD